jgi:hypothetical protein
MRRGCQRHVWWQGPQKQALQQSIAVFTSHGVRLKMSSSNIEFPALPRE